MENLLLLGAVWFAGTWLAGRTGVGTLQDLYARLPRRIAVWTASLAVVAAAIPPEWKRRGTIALIFAVLVGVMLTSRGKVEPGKRKGGTQRLEPRPPANSPATVELFAAVEQGQASDIGRLVNSAGANVNAQRDNGETPLHVACRLGYGTVVVELLKCGADFHVRNGDGKTPLQVATEAGYGDIGDSIRRHIESIRQVPLAPVPPQEPVMATVHLDEGTPGTQPLAAAQPDGDAWEQVQACLDEDKLEAALAALDDVLAASPEDADAWNLRGTTLMRLSNYTDALRALDRAVQLTPDSALTLRLKGLCLLQLGQPAAAAIWFERTLGLDGQDIKARLSLAEALEEQEKWDEALAAYDAVLTSVPDHPTAMNQKAACLADAGRLEEAVVLSKKAVDRHADDPSTWMLRSILLDWVGNIDGSLTAQEKAVELGASPDGHLLDLRKAWSNPDTRLN